MPVTASAEASHRSSATARFGVSAAYLLNEADIAPCGRDSAALRPFLSAATEKHCPCRNSGCTLSRAPLDGCKNLLEWEVALTNSCWFVRTYWSTAVQLAALSGFVLLVGLINVGEVFPQTATPRQL